MKGIESPWDLPDKTVDRAIAADRDIRISDFVLFAILPLRSIEVAGLPVNEFSMAALVGLCLFRRPRGGAVLWWPILLMGAGLMALLVGSGVANDVDWTRRIGHLAIMGGVIWAGGTGRLSLRSAACGLAAGLIGVIGLASIGVGGAAYVGRLTGYLGDPNGGRTSSPCWGCWPCSSLTTAGRCDWPLPCL